MANIFKPKRSTTPLSAPTTGDLVDGELAVNIPDGKIYIRNGSDINELGEYNWDDNYNGSTKTGIHTTLNVGIGTTTNDVYLEVGPIGASGTSLIVNGDTNITGILTASNTIEHLILDDISSGFDGSTTAFTISSSTINFLNSEIPTPARLMLSIGGIVQQPDPGGNNGYDITGGTDKTTDPLQVVFAEAPKSGQPFFGVAFGYGISREYSYVTYNTSLVNSIVFGV